ncbi:tRNA dimethylallyltransferase [Microlunatus endophyticus]|uniref:tRNA dimethylallyltransferase n=1 Tax=Microlunatus endophyticus TaxID=1716077 RepID=A0A917S2Y9_9ACTN|nr:tRNA (adenosine(37)-N6)-dimethylallyltransferase MiaA [Microlunatus endophyticus]GGL50689.1 tRNA dimethylallyltransferase [Microlunatus endophyticus]
MQQGTQPNPTGILVPVLVGATASGKTSLAVRLAQRLTADDRPAEIVNADAMLIYRGMDIGTAKPSVAERGGVRHHLIDILDVTQTASVAEFQARARDAIADCRRRGVVPVVVGGSALYVRAVVDRFEFPGTDPVVRGRLEDELARIGPEALHRRLGEVDPPAAATIEPGNGRRIVRALEVIELTGTAYAARLPEHTYALDGVVQIGLDVPRPVLDQRIADRVQQMWSAGFVDEVRRLERAGLRDGVTASRGLGYRQILDFLDGMITEAEARDRTIAATRRFARRQDGWFRKDPRISWFDPDDDRLVDAVAALLARPERSDG